MTMTASTSPAGSADVRDAKLIVARLALQLRRGRITQAQVFDSLKTLSLFANHSGRDGAFRIFADATRTFGF